MCETVRNSGSPTTHRILQDRAEFRRVSVTAANRRGGVLEFSWKTSFWKISPAGGRLFAGGRAGELPSLIFIGRSDRASGRLRLLKPLDLARIRAPRRCVGSSFVLPACRYNQLPGYAPAICRKSSERIPSPSDA